MSNARPEPPLTTISPRALSPKNENCLPESTTTVPRYPVPGSISMVVPDFWAAFSAAWMLKKSGKSWGSDDTWSSRLVSQASPTPLPLPSLCEGLKRPGQLSQTSPAPSKSASACVGFATNGQLSQMSPISSPSLSV